MVQASKAVAVSGPITGGKHGWPFAASMLDIASLGYQQAEYFIEGEACRYRQVEGSDWGRDGRWQVEPAGTAPFKTRLLVYRPADPQHFNGTVIVTWNNVTAGYDPVMPTYQGRLRDEEIGAIIEYLKTLAP